ncbi:MAG: DUF3841 domain-containing protein [Lachnospiraceae bacterium]|nr:DUF3841 domain-containing protein [Lachnospiraceae bacterium]
MSQKKHVIMWTSQTGQVADVIAQDGVSYVKKEFIDMKYGDVAWVFKTAYDFFIRKMEQRVVKPEEAESPVWLFKDPKWVDVGSGMVLMKLTIPEEELVYFDTRKWSKILNLGYIGNQKEEEDFEAELKRQGIRDTMEVFAKPFYPLVKRKIMQSWERVFDIDGVDEQYLQGAVWCIKKEWIQRI